MAKPTIASSRQMARRRTKAIYERKGDDYETHQRKDFHNGRSYGARSGHSAHSEGQRQGML
jgi:hypothetical protein